MIPMKKKMLICGATGFIGRNCFDFFSKSKKYNIYGIYNKVKPFKARGITWLKCDLRDETQVEKVTKGMDIVIHAAATTPGSKDVINQPFVHVTDNAVMNAYIFRSCFLNKVGHVIFFSCTTMYKSSKVPLKENNFDPRKDINPKYFGVATTKVYNEKMCEFYSGLGSTKFTAIRHSNIYGPYEKKKVLDQGTTSVNGQHQGAWVQTQSGEDWFIHFQDKGIFGRVVHLQPMKWEKDWPLIATDNDGDGRPDDCDSECTTLGMAADPDDDNDGVEDGSDTFPLDSTESVDTDGDGVGDNGDAFPSDATESLDTDSDSIGNNTDSDDDNDGLSDQEETTLGTDSLLKDTDGDSVDDNVDALPLDASETLDTDSDGTGDNADTDDDGDFIADAADSFPLDPSETSDVDADGIGDSGDTDADADGVVTIIDAFPEDPTETTDSDNDGTTIVQRRHRQQRGH